MTGALNPKWKLEGFLHLDCCTIPHSLGLPNILIEKQTQLA